MCVLTHPLPFRRRVVGGDAVPAIGCLGYPSCPVCSLLPTSWCGC
jgi:hypothetical protein